MKTLDLEQMEQIEGGDPAGCLGAYAALGAMLFTVAALSGPVGWLTVGAFAAVGYGTGLAIGSECM